MFRTQSSTEIQRAGRSGEAEDRGRPATSAARTTGSSAASRVSATAIQSTDALFRLRLWIEAGDKSHFPERGHLDVRLQLGRAHPSFLDPFPVPG